MKKLLNKITKSLFIIALAASNFTFLSCQDLILPEIRNEVQLEKGTIFGDIYSIIRVGDWTGENGKIFCANGTIYSKDKKENTHGAWEEEDMPDSTGRVLQIAADKNYLYALSFYYDEDTTKGEMAANKVKLFYKEIDLDDDDIFEPWKPSDLELKFGKNTINKLFCTNSIKQSNRFAFINSANAIYQLDGKTYTKRSEQKMKSCAYLNGVQFFTGEAACSNETETTDATAIYYGTYIATNTFNSNNKTTTIKIKTATGDSDFATSGLGSVLALAVMKNSILVCTDNGTNLIDLEKKSEITFVNMTSTLSTLYESPACLAVDPSKTATENAIYASLNVRGTGSNSALFSHEGLWSYYPSRSKWNIE